jgi:hypothetical protein
MNIFIQMLASDSVPAAPDITPRKFDIEDNVGESIHVHLRNVRLEMSVADFDRFADQLAAAREELDDGHR